MIDITQERYDELLCTERKMQALEAGGVDNWQGYNDSLEEFYKEEEKLQCHQDECNNPATHRYTWPGRDEEVICLSHGEHLSKIAQAVGLQLQRIPLKEE